MMLRLSVVLLVAFGVLFGTIAYISRPTILVNGHIITMEADSPFASAMGIHADIVQAVGSDDQVEDTMRGVLEESAWFARVFGIRRIDLQGKTVVPGFIDAHGHFPASGIAAAGIDVSSPPFGTATSIDSILETVAHQSHEQSAERWIIGFDYDDAGLLEKRHPTRAELDEAAPGYAVYLRHRSGHMGVANSRALRELGLDSDNGVLRTDDSLTGGIITTETWTNGLLQEHAAPGMRRLLDELAWWKLPGIVFRARDEYLRAGVTTVQNGYADKPSLQVLRWSSKLGIVPQRLVFWPAHEKTETPDPWPLSIAGVGVELTDIDSGNRLARMIGWPQDAPQDLKIGAIKLLADGSPQGRTAWLSEPYLHEDGMVDGYDGLPYLPEDILHTLIRNYHRAGIQLAIHGNGDAAVQSIIDGIRLAQLQYPRNDARHILVHAQVITEAQLAELSELGIGVSFFPGHTFYWGDWYRYTVLGEARARAISPLASADKAGVRYSIHADSPVTPMNPMQMLWSATERRTRSGYVLGPEQRIGRLRALRAMTIDAAWQNFIDNDRGSLTPGKLADFVVLSDDPLSADDVREISAQQVWIGGKLEYSDQE